VSVQITILGSGSAGNSTYIETPEARLLVDAGFSGRQIRQRLASIGRSPETLTGILITHEHSDHVQGLGAMAGKLRIPIYANRFTQEAIEAQLEMRFEFRLFVTGSSFEIGDTLVESFSIPHDAQDPVGFLLRTPVGNIGFLTDLGHATRMVVERVRPAQALVLESNHDVKLLQDDPRRPWSLKQRIMSRHGHLSNDAAGEVISQVVSGELRHLFLGHLSRDCNRPELARAVADRRLEEAGARHVTVAVTSQDQVSRTCSL